VTTNTPIHDSEYEVNVWFERDRKNIRLETPAGRIVFDFWDEAVDDVIESGFLSVPSGPRPTEKDWLPHAVAYAREQGLIT